MTLQPLAIRRSALGLLSGTFRSLRHRNYRLFFFGQLISMIGTWLQNTALSWLVWSITHDSMTMGLMSFLGSIPVLFLTVYAGTLADERPKRTILIMTQVAAGVQAILLAVAIWTHSESVIVLGAANLLLGIINAFEMPTRQAFVVEMASKEDATNAVALNSAKLSPTAKALPPMFVTSSAPPSVSVPATVTASADGKPKLREISITAVPPSVSTQNFLCASMLVTLR